MNRILERIAGIATIVVLAFCAALWRKAYDDEQAKYRALLETRTGEVLNEPHDTYLQTDKPCTPEMAEKGENGCSNDWRVTAPPPYTGWIETALASEKLFMRQNQPCGMYHPNGNSFAVAFDSDTEPIRMYRTEREARRAVEEGCK